MLGPSVIVGGVPLAFTYALRTWSRVRGGLAGTALVLAALQAVTLLVSIAMAMA